MELLDEADAVSRADRGSLPAGNGMHVEVRGTVHQPL
jgi:hypothetical protein